MFNKIYKILFLIFLGLFIVSSAAAISIRMGRDVFWNTDLVPETHDFVELGSSAKHILKGWFSETDIGTSTESTTTITDLTVSTGLTIPNNSVDEVDINFTTVCASGNHLYVSGDNLACEADFWLASSTDWFSIAQWNATDTDALSEGVSNLYFTDARARASISETITGITYNSGTGVFSLDGTYIIPLSASTTNFQTAYNWGDHSTAGYYATSSDLYVLNTGDTINGNLTITGLLTGQGTSTLATTTATKLTMSGNIIMPEDGWIGIGGADDRIVFNGGSNTIEIPQGAFLIGPNNTNSIFEISAVDSSVDIYFIRDDDTIGSGNDLGQIFWGGDDADDQVLEAASIKVEAAAEWTAGDASPTRMGFYTLQNGAVTAEERMRIDHNGDIYIGNETGNINGGDLYMIMGATAGDPQVKFDLDAIGTLTITADTRNIALMAAYNVGIGTTTPTTTLEIVGSAGTNPLNIASSTGTSLLTILQNGNVGIGTSSPSESLDVVGGDITIGHNQFYRATRDTNSAKITVMGFKSGSNFLSIKGGSSDGAGGIDLINTADDLLMRINGNGNVGINTTGPDRKLDILDASNPQLRLTHTDGSVYAELQASSTGDLLIDASGGDIYTFDRFGIGVFDPDSPLEITSGAGADTAILHMSETSVSIGYFWELADTDIAGINAKNLVIRGSSSVSDIALSPSTAFPGLLFLDGSAGNIGIATTSPVSKLSVEGNLLIDGTVIFTGVATGTMPVNSSHLATKEYVDTSIDTTIDLFFNDTASGISGTYLSMKDTETGDVESNVASTSLAAGASDQFITAFITGANALGFDTIQAGIFDGHFHIARTNGARDVNVYWTLSQYTTSAVETLLLTSEMSGLITSKTSITIHSATSSEIELNSDDRLVFKIFANIGSGGGTVDVTVYMEGSTDSHVTLQTPSSVFSEIFVRQDGTKPLTGNWGVGGFNITGIGALTVQGDATLASSTITFLSVGTTTIAETLYIEGQAGTDPFNVASSTGTSLFRVKQDGTIIINSDFTGVLRADNGVMSTTSVGAGTVTSVAMTVPTGFVIGGSPITTSGTLALTYHADYSAVKTASSTAWQATTITVNASSSDWQTAYNWGDHSGAGYITDVFSCSTGDCSNVTVETGDTLKIDDDVQLSFGSDSDWQMEYNTVTSTQMRMFTSATSTGDLAWGMFQINVDDQTIVGANMLANQSVFMVSKGLLSNGTFLLNVDAEGDTFITGDLALYGGNLNTGNIALTIGDATTDTITFLSDGTGNAEFTFPADVIGTADLDWGSGAGQIDTDEIPEGSTNRYEETTAGYYLTLTVASIDLDIEIYSRSVAFSIINATTTKSATSTAGQFQVPYASTITKVSCNCGLGTSTIQLDERVWNASRAAGTDILSSTLECNTTTASSTAFANVSIAQNAWVNLDIDGLNSCNEMTVSVYIKPDD